MKAVPIGEKDTNGDITGRFYTLSHPMVFTDPGKGPEDLRVHMGFLDPVYTESATVYVCSVKGLIPRVVIHAARALQGSDGLAYGGFGVRLVEGISNPEMALMLQGYQVD